MSIDTVTLYLSPADVAITEYFDPVEGDTYTFTIEKEKAPYFVKLILDKLSQQDKSKIDPQMKADIIRGAGLKYPFSIPSVLRALAIGLASGIALKTFSDSGSKAFLEKCPSVALASISWIQRHPYLSSAAIGGACLATTQVSQKISHTISTTVDKTFCIAKNVTKTLAESVYNVGKFCERHPIKILALGTVILGLIHSEKSGIDIVGRIETASKVCLQSFKR